MLSTAYVSMLYAVPDKMSDAVAVYILRLSLSGCVMLSAIDTVGSE